MPPLAFFSKEATFSISSFPFLFKRKTEKVSMSCLLTNLTRAVVEHSPCIQGFVGSDAAGCWAFCSHLVLSYSYFFFNRFLLKVPRQRCSIKRMLSWADWVETDLICTDLAWPLLLVVDVLNKPLSVWTPWRSKGLPTWESPKKGALKRCN